MEITTGTKYLAMKNIVFLVSLIGCLLTTACHQPEELLPPVSRNGLNSITVKFPDGSGEFTAQVDPGSSEIVINIPYYFPENSNNQVTEEMIRKMKAKANLDDNVVIEPALVFLDLSQPTNITVIDQRKERKHYSIRGNIKKSDACLITDFRIPSLGLSGVINDTDQTISLITAEDLSQPVLVEMSTSFHATVAPDPRVDPLSFESGQELTVTAHNGIAKRTYTITKSIPEKVPFGIRTGSAKLLFAKQLNADLGIPSNGQTRGFSLSGDYLVLNTSGANSTCIHALTGEKAGEIDLGALKGANANYYATSDKQGNILICNKTPQGGGSFKIWKMSSTSATPELLIDYPTSADMGRRFSINGDINGEAILTAPLYGASPGSTKFARWTIRGGNLSSNTPEIVTLSGFAKTWTNNCDIICSSPNDVEADYFVNSYSEYLSWVKGASNSQHKKIAYDNNNFVPNAIDHAPFNGAQYIAFDWTNAQTWGSADIVYLLNVTDDSGFTGNLEKKTVGAVVWEAEKGKYGARALASQGSAADVLLRVSDNGYYLYLYFMFTNGYVVAYQFDCIKM